MPSATARRLYEDQLPSFMSVFDLGPESMEDRGLVAVDPQMIDVEAPKLNADSQPQLRPTTFSSALTTHKHNDSTSTQTSESAESSPTTTASCTDSCSMSDPSPSSSPDSPINLVPLSSFGATSFGGLPGMAGLTVSDSAPVRPMTSPGPRKAKNMKGLSIQPPLNTLSSALVNEPASPAFIKPVVPSMRRKPSQLSLKTNTSDLITRTTLDVPQSPALPPILQRRALKHSTSSPQILSALQSATFGPIGGMTIPTVLERNESGLSEFLRPSKPPSRLGEPIPEEDSPIKAQVANRVAYDFEPYHEVENNEDQKSPGYPDGPIAIYSDNVYLYLEPTAEEASRFDVVINVASEVKNPFDASEKTQRGSDTPVESESTAVFPIPETAATTNSFSTAFEFQLADETVETPTTPKPAPFLAPEYIHMPWEHNTNIVPDLMMLCETIEKKTKQGKKVLIHCQQGASRSASLIIAYGMYQNPDLSVNDAYYAAQSKSRWISPNMRLMYCLQDFQKEVGRKRLGTSGMTFPRPRSGKSPTKHRMTLSVDNIEVAPKEPLTAPLPGEEGETDRMTGSPTSRARGNSTPTRGEAVSPGPSSAPSSFSWDKDDIKNSSGTFGSFPRNLPPASTQPVPDHAPLGLPPKSRRSPTLAPLSLSKPPPSPGFAPLSFSRPPPSPGFAPLSLSRPPPSFGLAHMSTSKAPPSLGLAPLSLSRPPPSPGLAPMSLSQPPTSPGFAPINFSKPWSFGLGSRRPGGLAGGFGLQPLNLTAPSSQDDSNPGPSDHHIGAMPGFPDDDALMSPRAETMTNNPLHGPTTTGLSGLQFIEVPPTPSEGLFSPRETMFPRDPFFPFGRPTQVVDPRSPPTKGETPIVRSIDDVL